MMLIYSLKMIISICIVVPFIIFLFFILIIVRDFTTCCLSKEFDCSSERVERNNENKNESIVFYILLEL